MLHQKTSTPNYTLILIKQGWSGSPAIFRSKILGGEGEGGGGVAFNCKKC